MTGLCIAVLAAGLPVAALADQTGEPGTTAVTTTADPNTSETAAPTADADLVMWNAEPASAPQAAEPAAPAAATVAPHSLARLLHVQRFASSIAARGAAMASSLTRNALRFLGVPYSFGGTTRSGFDCSGYVQHVFAMMGRRLPRTADAQYAAARRFKGTNKPGDLVFFQTYEPGPSHVGISLGGDRFVHASSSHGVTVSTLHDSYWAARYLGAKRIVE